MSIEHRTDNRNTQRIKGFLDHVLLALIAQRPRYGLELMEMLNENHLIAYKEGSVYPLLGKMREEGLISVREERSAQSGRVRRYYEILPEGEGKLMQLNESWEEFKSRMDSAIGNGS